MYLIPEMAIFSDKWNNMRMFGILLLLLLSGIVAVGVKIVSLTNFDNIRFYTYLIYITL